MISEFKKDLYYIKDNFWKLLRLALLYLGSVIFVILFWLSGVMNILIYLGLEKPEAWYFSWGGMILTYAYIMILKLRAEGRDLERTSDS